MISQAYILGKSDEQYAHVIASLYGIVFLATPHRGSSLARTLNYVLSVSPAGTSAKHFIADLEKNSSSLQDINEQFRFLYGDVALVSFYETQKTSLAPGVKKFVSISYSAGNILGAKLVGAGCRERLWGPGITSRDVESSCRRSSYNMQVSKPL